MGFIGEYTLRLYCDHVDNDGRHDGNYYRQFHGADRADCLKQARAYGWSIGLRAVMSSGAKGFGRSLCPLHTKTRKR